MRFESLQNRFDRLVRRGRGCWEWTGSLNRNGYGMAWDHRHMILAHRLSWMLHVGPIPRGNYVCHHCDNPKCVRPEHLFLGTQFDNMRDCARKGRIVVQLGEKNWAAKLTAERVVAIRELRQLGMKIADICQRFGLGPAQVHNILARRAWRHVA